MAKEKIDLMKKFKDLAKFDNGIHTLDNEKAELQSFEEDDMISYDCLMMNVIMSGKIDGGLMPGIEVFAAPSGTGKTFFGLKTVEAFQKKFDAKKEDHITLYFDSEFGARDMLDGFDIDKSKILHIPIKNIEELHHNMLAMLDDMDKKMNVMLFVDSVGNLASKKELVDALDGKSVADMTRAKTLKAFFRQITPYINLNHVYTYMIGHTYDSQGMFPSKVVSGGTGLAYSPNGVYVIGRSQIKNDKLVIGHNMGVLVEKSRTIRRGSKFILRLMYDGGLQKYSYIPELAEELGVVERIRSKGIVLQFGKHKINVKQAYHGEKADAFWGEVFKNTDFKKKIEDKFLLTI